MTIATRNGAVLVTSGAIAESCGCCGCTCAAPQQMRLSFTFNELPSTTRQVVVTQSAYAAVFGGQITNIQAGFFDRNSPYPFESYYGVAGYYYDFVYQDPQLGTAPPASALQGQCQWVGRAPSNILRASANLQIFRRATDQEGGLLYPRDSNCFYLRWSYGEVQIDGNCFVQTSGAYSAFDQLSGGSVNNFVSANFVPKLSPCCIGTGLFYGRTSVGSTFSANGSAYMAVLDCA